MKYGGRVNCRSGPSFGLAVVHHFVHFLQHSSQIGADALENIGPLSWRNATQEDRVDIPAHPLKVETRVRIPLGLLSGLSPIRWTGFMTTRPVACFRDPSAADRGVQDQVPEGSAVEADGPYVEAG